jgi:hypothetical protein
MKKTLYIHIGWHKTATSLIQQHLHDHRMELREHDICYPTIHDKQDPKAIKHAYLYLSIINKLHVPHLQEDLSICDFDALFAHSIKEIKAANCGNTIISEEGLSQVIPGIPKLMGRYKEHFDEVKIVAFVRRQDIFLESLYAQFVKQKPERSRLPFDEYLQLEKVQQRADYDLILGWWAEEFGQKNIVVAPFEVQKIIPDPLGYFFNVTGLPKTFLDDYPLNNETLHVSPPREVTEFMRHLNLIDTPFFPEVLVRYLTRDAETVTNTKYFCRKEREEILSKYEQSNASVARKYLKRDDAILFEEGVKDYDNCKETWTGLSQEELLNMALPASGRMSVEISWLFYKNLDLKKRNEHLINCNQKLEAENRRIGSFRKSIYRYFQHLYRKMILFRKKR